MSLRRRYTQMGNLRVLKGFLSGLRSVKWDLLLVMPI